MGTSLWIGGCICRKSGALTAWYGPGASAAGGGLSDQAAAGHRHAGTVPGRTGCLCAGSGDEVYGESTVLRAVVAASGRWYVLAVRSIVPVWPGRPAEAPPPARWRGRPRTHPRWAEGRRLRPPCGAVTAWPELGWRRLTVAEGEKGPLTYDWAWTGDRESRHHWPGPESWPSVRASAERSDGGA